MEPTSKYGIRIADKDGNKLEYIDDYGKCFILVIDNIELAKTIPKKYMDVDCSLNTDHWMPDVQHTRWPWKSPAIFILQFDDVWLGYTWEHVGNSKEWQDKIRNIFGFDAVSLK